MCSRNGWGWPVHSDVISDATGLVMCVRSFITFSARDVSVFNISAQTYSRTVRAAGWLISHYLLHAASVSRFLLHDWHSHRKLPSSSNLFQFSRLSHPALVNEIWGIRLNTIGNVRSRVACCKRTNRSKVLKFIQLYGNNKCRLLVQCFGGQTKGSTFITVLRETL